MRPTVCLNMIVRDEAAVVAETLDSVVAHIDTWAIVDTGSTDDTIAVVRDYFAARGIPGELHERPWRNFGANRTEALELAAGRAHYIWVMDADDLLVGALDLTALTADSYFLRYGTDVVYWRKQLFRSGLRWRYEGVVHEWPTCADDAGEERLEGDYHVEPRHLGARSRDPQKYARDAELLLAEHRRDPEDPRTVFYLAQSYLAAGEPRKALDWYERRTRMDGFAEEVYYSLLRRAGCLAELGAPDAGVTEAYLESWQARPGRAEPLCELAARHRIAEKPDLAYLFACRASEIPFPEDDRLFVDASVYRWRSLDERAIAAYYTGRHAESLDLCTRLLQSPELPEWERDRVLANRGFAIRQLSPDRGERPYYVKPIGNSWPTAQALCDQWERQSQGRGRWSDVQVTAGDDADYFAVVNFPHRADERYVPDRTIVFQMEPRSVVSQWQEWAAPDPREFLQVRSHARFRNNVEWHLGLTYAQLKTTPIEKTKVLSTVTSSRVEEPGQRLRVEFLRYLERCGTAIDVYGTDNAHGLASYVGPLPPLDKSGGILPYRYTFAAENNAERNYFTEKIVDAILGECLCFYWGCPNLEDHIDGDAFVRLPLEDFARSRAIVEHAIADGEWERRLPAIRAAKARLLDEQQFFPTLARIVHGHRLAERLPIRVINLDRRPERWASFRERTERAAGAAFLDRCERFTAVDGGSLAPTPALERLFRDNRFGFRRGVAGCALSHLELWRQAASDGSAGMLVLEDDARLSRGFWGHLVEICGAVAELDPAPDLVLLGHSHWNTQRERERHDEGVSPRIEPLAWDDYLGGLAGYIVLPGGARKLLAIVERHGIQEPIDAFVLERREELNVVTAVPEIVCSPVVVSLGGGVESDIQYDAEPVGAGSPPAARRGPFGEPDSWTGLLRLRGEPLLRTLAPSLELGDVPPDGATCTPRLDVAEGTLVVTREELLGGERSAHRLLLLDRDSRLAAASPRFRIAGDERERCTGLALLDGRLALAYRVDDQPPRLAVLDADEALGLLTSL